MAKEIGVVEGVESSAFGTPPAESKRQLDQADDVFADEIVETVPDGSLHLKFLDNTDLRLGANAKIALDNFVFDPNANTGELSLDIGRGIFRMVTGEIPSEGVTVQTPVATMGVRGTDWVGLLTANAFIVFVVKGSIWIRPLFGEEIQEYIVNELETVSVSLSGRVTYGVSIPDYDPGLGEDLIEVMVNPEAGGEPLGPGGPDIFQGGSLAAFNPAVLFQLIRVIIERVAPRDPDSGADAREDFSFIIVPDPNNLLPDLLEQPVVETPAPIQVVVLVPTPEGGVTPIIVVITPTPGVQVPEVVVVTPPGGGGVIVIPPDPDPVIFDIFTPDDDTVDLSNLVDVITQAGLDDTGVPILQAAIENDGYNISDALEGDDDVILPDEFDFLRTFLDGLLFNAGPGNDTVAGGNAADTIAGGFGSVDTLYGGEDDDALYGDNADGAAEGDIDTLYGDAGSDEIFGEGNDDLLYGGDDGDLLAGDSGVDNGDVDGNDQIYGGAAGDTAFGDGGLDTLYGDGAGDTLYGGSNPFVFPPGSDAPLPELLYGGEGSDTLYGGTGTDLLYGGTEDDSLFGGEGDDTLDGGAGQDQFDGGPGEDVVRINAGDIPDFSTETAFGGTAIEDLPPDNDFNTDLLELIGDNFGNLFEITVPSPNPPDSDVQILFDNGTLIVNEFEDIEVIGNGGGDQLSVGDLSDSTIRPDTVRFFGGTGSDVLYGGGEFLVTVANVNLVGEGGFGADTLFGGDGLDQLFGEGGFTFALEPEDGDDDQVATLADDTLAGNNGEDELFGDVGFSLSARSPDAPSARITGGNDELYGGADSDQIYGDAGSDILARDQGASAYGGDDLIYGDESGNPQGNDTLYGDAGGNIGAEDGGRAYGGDDKLYGESGNDTLYGDAGFDLFATGMLSSVAGGNDEIHGDGSNDLLFGDAGDELRASGSDATSTGGEDTVYGGTGEDAIYGDAGTDLLASSGGAVRGGSDVLYGGGDSDAPTEEDVVYGDSGGSITATGTDSAAYGGDDTLYGGISFDTLYGDVGGDISASGGASAGGGNDTLYGEADEDVLYGDAGGNDNMLGGNDTLYGGNDDDSLYGGSGDDTLYGDGIENGQATQGVDLLYGGEGFDELYGGALEDVLFGGSDGDFLDGGVANDTIAGGLGNDTLKGDLGADRFLWELGDDDGASDVIEDFFVADLDGDIIDLTDIISIAGTDDINNFVVSSQGGGNTTLTIDPSGQSGGGATLTIVLQGELTTTDALVFNGQIDVTVTP